MLCTFELFLEDRGGSIKVLMEGGPRLASGVFRLVDLAVQHVGVHSIGAWMLYDDQEGRRKMHCVPLAFTDGEVKSSVEVLLIEEQIESCVVGGDGATAAGPMSEQQIEMLSRFATTLESSITSSSTNISNTSTRNGEDSVVFRATDVFQDAIFAPGHFCRPALQNAFEQDLHQLFSSTLLSSDDICQLDIASLRDVFTQAVNTVAEGHLQGPMGIWITVLQAYTHALRSYFAPRALVKLSVHRDEEQGLLLVRSGGSLSVVRAAEPAEIVSVGAWPPIWDKLRSSDSTGVKSILDAASVVMESCLGGRQVLMMIQGCIVRGADFRAEIVPAVLRWILSSTTNSGRGGNGGDVNDDNNRSASGVPLKLGTLCSAPKNGFASAIEAIVTLLAHDCVPPGGHSRSPLASFSVPVISASMAQAHQTAAAQCECLLRVAVLAAYVTSQHQLGAWTVPEQDRQVLLGSVSEKLDWMVAAAGVAFWSTAAPIAAKITHGEHGVNNTSPLPMKPTASDTANMVISLRIGDDDAGGGSGADGGRSGAGATNISAARKRARLTPTSTPSNSHYAYPAEHLLSTFQSHAHAVRDLPDLQGIARTFSSWLLCVPKVHDIDLRRKTTPTESIALKRTLEVAPVLVRTHSAAALTELMAMSENILSNDPRVLFFTACSKAITLASLTSTSKNAVATKKKLEKESVSLFFRVAATFAHRSFFKEQLHGVTTALEDLLSSFMSSSSNSATNINKIDLPADATESQIGAADELHYHESLMVIFEKLGCHHAASRFAMAAAQHVPAAFPNENMAEERVKRTGRLWSAVFTFCLESGEFEEAYTALLGNDLADVQVDCVHKLVNAMVDRGEIAALCALPFAHTALVVRNGQPAWVSLLDEAVVALEKRVALTELESNYPQPSQVLFDFHVARGNYQSAASAMVSYARRLAAEAPEDRNAVEAAQKALAAAVGALGLVDPERAWLEDPRGGLKPVSSSSLQRNTISNEDDEEGHVLWAPSILTMADLKIEHALAVAKSSVAAVLPGGDIGTKTATEVFHQLVALKLHQEAFTLADAAFVGTKQQRMREKAMLCLATTCAELQLQTGIGGNGKSNGSGSYYMSNASDEGMLTEDGGAAAAAEENDGGAGAGGNNANLSSFSSSAASASASWKRLRTHLETYEKPGSQAGAMNLRVLAVDAVLATNASLQPPLWLLAPFFPPPTEGPLSAKMPNADVAGLLRAYLKHGRVEDAAILAVKVLSRVADSVPSVVLSRPASVCLPHALLEELANRVPSTSPVKSDLAEKLSKAQAAAQRQTAVLENIYAA
jgi:hypothetical protein